MPEDVLEDLKRIAPALGHSGYQPLIRAYVGRGLREDLAQLEGSDVHTLVASLRRRGVDETLISKALADAAGRSKRVARLQAELFAGLVPTIPEQG